MQIIPGDQIGPYVTPRERRVSRNRSKFNESGNHFVTPRERRVSRNDIDLTGRFDRKCHASREACE